MTILEVILKTFEQLQSSHKNGYLKHDFAKYTLPISAKFEEHPKISDIYF